MSNKRESAKAPAPKGYINVGQGNFVRAERVLTILEASSLPVKRMRDEAGRALLLIDATAGRKTKSLLVLDSRHVVLSGLSTQVLADKMNEALQIDVENKNFLNFNNSQESVLLATYESKTQ